MLCIVPTGHAETLGAECCCVEQAGWQHAAWAGAMCVVCSARGPCWGLWGIAGGCRARLGGLEDGQALLGRALSDSWCCLAGLGALLGSRNGPPRAGAGLGVVSGIAEQQSCSRSGEQGRLLGKGGCLKCTRTHQFPHGLVVREGGTLQQ